MPTAAPQAVKRPSFTPGGLPKGALEWFERRGISQPTLERNKVTVRKVWFPQTQDERLAFCFPYYRDGELVNVKYRGKSDQDDKIFRQEKDAEKILCGLDDLDPEDGTLIIVEGEIDKLSLNEIGYWNVLSVPDGAPAKPLEDDTADDPENDTKFTYLWNCKEAFERARMVILAVDGDPPGKALEYELARRIGRAKCWRVRWPELAGDVQTKDANDVLVDAGAELLRETIEAAEPLPVRSLYDLDAYRDETTALYRGEIKRGVSTGWSMLDPLLKIRPGDLSVISGWPSSGKTLWLDSLCLNLARDHGWVFAVASFENPPEEHIANLAHSYVGAPFHDGPSMRMTESELNDAISWLGRHFHLIRADDESPTLDWLLEAANAAVLRYGINGLVIDPYNELDHHRPQGMSETEYVSQMLGKLKRFCILTDCHVFFVAHPGKPHLTQIANGQLAVPTMYSISGSAHWVNKPDIGIIVHRLWNEDGTQQATTEIHVKKVRRRVIGAPGVRTLIYDPIIGRYS